jgi:hypothetical protein
MTCGIRNAIESPGHMIAGVLRHQARAKSAEKAASTAMHSEGQGRRAKSGGSPNGRREGEISA